MKILEMGPFLLGSVSIVQGREMFAQMSVVADLLWLNLRQTLCDSEPQARQIHIFLWLTLELYQQFLCGQDRIGQDQGDENFIDEDDDNDDGDESVVAQCACMHVYHPIFSSQLPESERYNVVHCETDNAFALFGMTLKENLGLKIEDRMENKRLKAELELM